MPQTRELCGGRADRLSEAAGTAAPPPMSAVAHSPFPILNILGASVAVSAATMLAPLAAAFFNGEGALITYDTAFLIAFASGALLWLATRRFWRK